MSSFTLVQHIVSPTTGNPGSFGVTFGSNSAAGNMIVLAVMAGTNCVGNPTLPTSVSDDNGNQYCGVSATVPGMPTQAIGGLYVALNIKITPNNPITISVGGMTYMGAGCGYGGPSLIAMEFSVPASYLIFGSISNHAASGGNSQTNFLAGALGGPTTGPVYISIGGAANLAGAQACVLFVNAGVDCLAIATEYDTQHASTAWTSNGTVVGYTAETAGTPGGTAKSGCVAMLVTAMSTGCGSVTPALSVSCNSPPNGTVGTAYSHAFTASGGTGPYTYTIVGTVPGLTLSSSGALTGDPTTTGTFFFVIQAVDTLGAAGTVECSITIAAGGGSGPSNYGWTG
jgi:hypothetical protein